MTNTRARLLIVDDAPEMGLIVTRLGRRSGHEVSICTSVPAAWESLAHARPDLLVVDVNLPGESGLSLCRRVRSTVTLADLRMALFSLWDRPGDIAAGLEAGSDFVLSKALLCQPERWQQRVEELLKADQPYVRRLNGGMLVEADSAGKWVEAMNQVLRYQGQRQLGLDVLAVLVRRAAERASLRSRELLPDGLGLDAGRLARPDGLEIVLAFAIALANQVWCILGSIEGVALLRALAAAVPALAESLTPQ